MLRYLSRHSNTVPLTTHLSLRRVGSFSIGPPPCSLSSYRYLHPALAPPLVFAGLITTLWVYKVSCPFLFNITLLAAYSANSVL